MQRPVIAGLLSGFLLQAQSPDTLGDYLDAVARTAANFALSAPGLTATETLDQRGRRGFIEILRNRRDKIRSLDVALPTEFRTHHVVSGYALAEIGESRALHEMRTIVTMDGRNLTTADQAHHALTIGLQSPDDETKRRLLEDLERNQLEGAVTDFGPLILLFRRSLQKDYYFTRAGKRNLSEEPVSVLDYHQISGAQGLTVFKERTEEKQPASGEIWLRQQDLLPLRITMTTEERLAKKYLIRTESTVDYMASPFGLVPSHVVHKQFLHGRAAKDDLMVEDDFHYSDFHNEFLRIP